VTDYVTFEGRITPLEWGMGVYTVLPLPDAVTEALGKARRVEGEIADHPVNLAVTRAPVLDRRFSIPASRSCRGSGSAPAIWSRSGCDRPRTMRWTCPRTWPLRCAGPI
jgi:hypothetical protein